MERNVAFYTASVRAVSTVRCAALRIIIARNTHQYPAIRKVYKPKSPRLPAQLGGRGGLVVVGLVGDMFAASHLGVNTPEVGVDELNMLCVAKPATSDILRTVAHILLILCMSSALATSVCSLYTPLHWHSALFRVCLWQAET